MTMSSGDLPAAGDRDPLPETYLAPTAERLRDEIVAMRRAISHGSVVEQAMGMLMERYGCTPEDALDRLVRLSVQADARLTEVARSLVDVAPSAARHSGGGGSGGARRAGATPGDLARVTRQRATDSWPREVSGEGEFGTQVRAKARRTRTRAELLAAGRPQDLVDTVVFTGLTEFPPVAAVLGVLDDQGVLTSIAWYGVASPVVARWHRVPVDLPLPSCVVARTGQPRWLDGSAGARSGSGLGLGLPGSWDLAAVLPLADDSAFRGVLTLVWSGDRRPAGSDRAGVERIASAVAAAVAKLPVVGTPPAHRRLSGGTAAVSPATDPTVAVLDALLHPVLLCLPVLDRDGEVSDLRVMHANPATLDPAGRGAGRLTDRSFLELYPDSVRTGLFAACLRVLTTGVLFDLPRHPWQVTTQRRTHRAVADFRITRYRAGVLLSWVGLRATPREGGEARHDR